MTVDEISHSSENDESPTLGIDQEKNVLEAIKQLILSIKGEDSKTLKSVFKKIARDQDESGPKGRSKSAKSKVQSESSNRRARNTSSKKNRKDDKSKGFSLLK